MFATARTSGVLRRWACRRPILAILSTLAFVSGCVQVAGSGGDGTPPPADGNGGEGPAIFAVSIQVSNPTPQLHEEVTVHCTAQGAETESLTFDFQSLDVALQVDAIRGAATFVVTESDLGLVFDVTCSASAGTGRTAESRRVTIAPTE